MEEPNAGGGAVAAPEVIADPGVGGASGGVGSPASPWRKTTPPPVAGEAAVMGAESWPALEEARQKVVVEPTGKPVPGNAAGGDLAKGPEVQQAPPSPSQVSNRMHKFDGHANPNKNHQAHYKNGPKRRPPGANDAPPYPATMPYHQHPGQPIFYPVLPNPMMLHEYPYQPFAVPVPNHDPHVGKSGFESTTPPFAPVDQVGGNEGNRPMPPQTRGDHHAWRPAVGTHGARPHSSVEGRGHFNHTWQSHQTFGTRENTSMPHGVGPRTFVRPMAHLPPTLGYINGPSYPGPMPPMYYYMPAPPMEAMRGPPRFVQNQPAPQPVLSPEATELRAKILAQVEYYFSDTNLERDGFLKSLMDEQGWVPISKVADFNRLKRITTDVHLIVDVLASSNLLEVQDDKIRRRSDWSKWVSSSGATSVQSPSSTASMDNIMGESNTGGFSNKDDAFSSDQKKHPHPHDNKCNIDGAAIEAIVPDEELPNDAHSCSLDKGLSAMTIGGKPKSISTFSGNSRTHEAAVRTGDVKVPKVNTKMKVPESQSGSGFRNLPSDSPSFSGDQSTFMLDEELELEHAEHSRDGVYSHKRVDDEEDDFFVDDQEVNRLIIVTQDTRSEKDDKSCSIVSQAFSTEEASRINDALYYYESVHDRRTNNQRSSQADTADVDSKQFVGAKGNHVSIGTNGIEEAGQPIPRRRQSKGNRKTHTSHKQRFFAGNFAEIKKAYYKLSLKHHPDKNPDPESRALFVKVANAYEILKDEETREKYDYAVAHPEEFFYNTAQYYRAYYGYKTDTRSVLVGLLLIVSAFQYINQLTSYSQAIASVKQTPAYRNRLKALEFERTGGISSKKKGNKQMDKKVEDELTNEVDLQIQGVQKPSVWNLCGVQLILLPYLIGKLLIWQICWFWRYRVKKSPYAWEDACYLTRTSLRMPAGTWQNIDEFTKKDLVMKRLWEKANMERHIAEARRGSKQRRR